MILVKNKPNEPKFSNLWDKISKYVPIPFLAAILTFTLNQHSTIDSLNSKIVLLESWIKNDSIYIDKNDTSTNLNSNRIQGILDLVEREKILTSNLNPGNLEAVYTKDATYIKNIGGKVYKSTGYGQISQQYKDTSLRIEEVSKFNFRIYNTKSDNRQRPVEANLTYDIFIKYFYNNEERYELKSGKEFMKLIYDDVKARWLIKYFYIESA